MNRLPLAGRRVLITRATHQAGKLSEGLRALGAEPIEVPVLEIQPPADFTSLDRALRSLASYDWLILTSANAVYSLADRAAALGISLGSPKPQPQRTASKGQSLSLVQDRRTETASWAPEVLKGHDLSRAKKDSQERGALAPEGALPKIAAVGEATAAAARNSGFAVSLIPEKYVAESLVEALAVQSSGQKILLARAAIARDVIPDALRAAGAKIDVVDAYRNVMPQSAPVLLRQAFEKGIDAVPFTSSSSVTHLAEAAKAAGIAFPFAGVAAISIGPITSQTLREFDWEPAAEATPHDVPGLISALAASLRANS